MMKNLIAEECSLFFPADVFTIEDQLAICICDLSFKGKFTKYVAQGVPAYVMTEVWASLEISSHSVA